MNIDRLISPAWFGGQLLAFSGVDGKTDFENGLVANTLFTGPGIEIKLPARCIVRFPFALETATVSGDFFSAQGGGCHVRGAFLDAHHLLVEGSLALELVEECAPSERKIATLSQGNRLLVGSAACFDPGKINSALDGAIRARQTWLQHLDVPDFGDTIRGRAFARALAVMKGQLCSPEGIISQPWTTPDRWPHRRMWLWDSAFHAIGWRHLDPSLARRMIDAVFDHQAADGFVPHMMSPDNASDITQPPVLALAASLVDHPDTDPDWLPRLFPKLAAYVQWDLDHRDTDGDGLVEWHIENNVHCRSGESGMDNSTRFDSARQLGAVDFNAFLALECELLSGFASRLGKAEEAAAWAKKAGALSRRMMEKMYSPDLNFFCDTDPGSGGLSSVLACSGFLPLLCAGMSPAQLAGLLEHLDNPDTFGTPVPLPSVAEPRRRHSTDMWRGPMWVNMNWLIARGLDRYGQHDRANDLRRKTIEEIERWFHVYGVFFEYYDDLGQTPPPRLMRKNKVMPEGHPAPFPHQAIHDYGWTTTLYVDLLLTMR